MARVVGDLKERLKAAGLWRDFTALREELRAGGSSPVQSRNGAMERFMPQLEEWEKRSEERVPDGGQDHAQVAVTDPVSSKEEGGPPEGGSPVLPKPSSPPSGVASDVFAGKEESSIVAVIQWVARNLEVSDPRPEDAPSAEAWGMLLSYSRSPLRKDEFWDKVFTRLIPSRAQLGDEENAGVDGAAIMQAIDKVLAIREGAEGRG